MEAVDELAGLADADGIAVPHLVQYDMLAWSGAPHLPQKPLFVDDILSPLKSKGKRDLKGEYDYHFW
jgi:hypothetical protein